VDISKGDTHLCKRKYLEKEAFKIFERLDRDRYLVNLERTDLVTAAAEYYGEINMLHPFRESNGRAQRILFEHLIVNSGYQISWDGVDRSGWVLANIPC
jgi:cell filamentation protein